MEKNRKYTVEEKLDVVFMNTKQYLSSNDISKITGISEKNINRWIKQYSLNGIDGLKPKHGKGNKFAALHKSKSLSKQERLELENLKLRIENKRLKRLHSKRGWYKQETCFYLRCEYEIIKELSNDYPALCLCKLCLLIDLVTIND